MMRVIILGTGNMAREHANRFQQIDGVELVGCVDIFEDKLTEFADHWNIPNRFTTLEEAIEWGEFDAASNVTPDNVHYATTMQLIAAGKHVLCEKPLATDYPKAKEMADAISDAGLIGMVNLTYRNIPELTKMRQLVEAGELGTVKHIEASYLQSWLVTDAWGDWRTEATWLWRLSTAHGSNGTLGDIGIHILDFASYGAATTISDVQAQLKTFHKAEGDQIGEYRLDANDSFAMVANFSNGALGVIHATRWATGHQNDLTLRIFGEKGGLELVHTPHGSTLRGCLGANANAVVWEDIEAPGIPNIFEKFSEAVKSNHAAKPDFQDAAEIQRFLDLANSQNS